MYGAKAPSEDQLRQDSESYMNVEISCDSFQAHDHFPPVQAQSTGSPRIPSFVVFIWMGSQALYRGSIGNDRSTRSRRHAGAVPTTGHYAE
jgi:hypothetical protein